jgi:hypothetical protein
MSVPGPVELTGFGWLLLDSSRRFCRTAIQTAGEEAAQLIKASQSYHGVMHIVCQACVT